MKIGIVTRLNEEKWGGDLKALFLIKEGLEKEGHHVAIGPSALEVVGCDFTFITNTIWDQRNNYKVIDLFKTKFGVIGFHEDVIRYWGPAFGFYEYVEQSLGLSPYSDPEIGYEIEKIFEMPHLVYYHSGQIPKNAYYNYEILKNALLCIASSPTEAATIKRDCPSCNPKVVYWPPGQVEKNDYGYTKDFLEFTGLKKNDYILQVGRLEMRKNQLATVLATKDLDIPLVFIATSGYSPSYERTVIAAILQWRKAPTLIIHQDLLAFNEKCLRILPMPNKEKLSRKMLLSAYQNAGLNLHPAFSELPGFTFLESTKLGIPTIASEWCTVNDYFFDPEKKHSELDGRIRYCPPHHVLHIKKLVEELFGKRFSESHPHPIFKRQAKDVGYDISKMLKNLNFGTS